MTKLQQIKKMVTELGDGELCEFAAWFETLRAARWDRQLETDPASGKLDGFAKSAMSEFRTGKIRPL